ncbi:putative methyltransferase PMT27 [Hordeum vulgare]|nr:putative methyltransferase PMT27 [Hordeum vulgare]
MGLPVAPLALLVADNDNGGEFTMYHVEDTHMRGKDLSVVYTNNPISVEISIRTMEQLLSEDKYLVVGFDLEFTSGHAGKDQKVAIAQFTNNEQNSMVDPALSIIEPYYMKIKDERKKDKNALHSAWDQRVDEEHVKYVAKDAYTSYDMYRRIVDMRKCLCPAPDEGSSHRAVAGA